MIGYPEAVTAEEDELFGVPKLAIVGVGGAGNNSMNRLELLGGLNGVDRVAINTDKLHLDSIAVSYTHLTLPRRG